jgi:CheY-like chemotaxis protein
MESILAKPLSILFVEDEPHFQEVYRSNIQELAGCQVHFALDGVAALTFLEKEGADLVMLDLDLPLASGQEVLVKIKSNPKLQHVPVIIVTGSTDLDKQMELLEQGASDFIAKGAPANVFMARLKAQVRHKIALDRLQKLTKDRDVFSGDILNDVLSLKGLIKVLAQKIRHCAAGDILANKGQIIEHIGEIDVQARLLGAYAGHIIQAIKDTQKHLRIKDVSLYPHLVWTQQALSDKKGRLRIDLDIQAPLGNVLADENHLRLLLLNVFQNAIKHANSKGELTLKIGQTQSGEELSLPELRPVVVTTISHSRRHDPEDSSDVLNESSGVSLAIAERAAADLGGRVWLMNSLSGRLTYALALPMATGLAD